MKVRTLYEHDGYVVEFIKLDGSTPGLRPIPGYSHRVVVDRESVGFLVDVKDAEGKCLHKPGVKAAMLFLAKHARSDER